MRGAIIFGPVGMMVEMDTLARQGYRVPSHSERMAHHSEGSPQAHPGTMSEPRIVGLFLPPNPTGVPQASPYGTPLGFGGPEVMGRWGTSLDRQGAPAATLRCDVPPVLGGKTFGIRAAVPRNSRFVRRPPRNRSPT